MVWVPRGEQPIAKVNWQFEWLWVIGFVHPQAGQTFVKFCMSCKRNVERKMNIYQKIAITTAGLALSFAATKAQPALAFDFALKGTLKPMNGLPYTDFTGTYSIPSLSGLQPISSYQLTFTGGDGVAPLTVSNLTELPGDESFYEDNVQDHPGTFDLLFQQQLQGFGLGGLIFSGTPFNGTFINGNGAFGESTFDYGSLYGSNAQFVTSAQSTAVASVAVPEPSMIPSLLSLGLGWLMYKKVASSRKV